MIRARLAGLVGRFRDELQVYRLVLAHERTPKTAKVFLALALGYLLLPFDIIPDWIPVLGQLDDALIVPLLVFLAVRMTPAGLVAECRARVHLKK
jgi:uncharacterized membrane protein YkvA (DUF1232 family)